MFNKWKKDKKKKKKRIFDTKKNKKWKMSHTKKTKNYFFETNIDQNTHSLKKDVIKKRKHKNNHSNIGKENKKKALYINILNKYCKNVYILIKWGKILIIRSITIWDKKYEFIIIVRNLYGFYMINGGYYLQHPPELCCILFCELNFWSKLTA